MAAEKKAQQVVGVSGMWLLIYSHPGGFEVKEEYEVEDKLKWGETNSTNVQCGLSDGIPVDLIENSPRFTKKTTIKKVDELDGTIESKRTAECDKTACYVFQEIIVVRVKSEDNTQYELKIPTPNLQTREHSIAPDYDKFMYYQKKK